MCTAVLPFFLLPLNCKLSFPCVASQDCVLQQEIWHHQHHQAGSVWQIAQRHNRCRQDHTAVAYPPESTTFGPQTMASLQNEMAAIWEQAPAKSCDAMDRPSQINATLTGTGRHWAPSHRCIRLREADPIWHLSHGHRDCMTSMTWSSLSKFLMSRKQDHSE